MPDDNQNYFETIIQEIEDAELGNLFGKVCGKINKKAFVAFYEGDMVFKIGRETVTMLLQKYEGAQQWDPSKKQRLMKDWIQIPAEYKSDWQKLAVKVVDFMA